MHARNSVTWLLNEKLSIMPYKFKQGSLQEKVGNPIGFLKVLNTCLHTCARVSQRQRGGAGDGRDGDSREAAGVSGHGPALRHGGGGGPHQRPPTEAALPGGRLHLRSLHHLPSGSAFLPPCPALPVSSCS